MVNEDIKEVEETLEDEEVSEEGSEEVSEDRDEVSDFFIGDIGLTTAKTRHSRRNKNLEASLVDEPMNKLERREEENYNVNEEGERIRVYEEGGDVYIGDNGREDLYSGDSSGMYNSGMDIKNREFYDPRIGKAVDIGEVHQADVSKLEIVGLRKGFGCSTEKDIRRKGDDKKYH